MKVLQTAPAAYSFRSAREARMRFEVPCECGRRLSVTGGDAGAALRCDCGRTVQVPGLHELGASAPAPAPAPKSARPPRDLSVLRLIGAGLVVAAVVWQF